MAGSAPLRIALNATAAVTGGGITYWLNLLPALDRLDTGHEFIVYAPEGEERLPLDTVRLRVERVGFPRPRALSRMAWEQLRLPGLLDRAAADVLLAAADVAPLRGRCPVVLAIRNENPYAGPRASTLAGRVRERILRELTRRSARRAEHVYFVSESSRRRVAPLLGLDGRKTGVIHHGVAAIFSEGGGAAAGAGLEVARKPYVLCVSAIRVHKDLLTLIEAFTEFRRSAPSGPETRLLIAGRVIDAPFHEKLLALVRESELAGSVVFCGELPYDALPRLYREAELFVFPTLAETFGHPLVEAMASGTPVVATDLDVCREVCGPAAVYSRAGDARDLASAMIRIVTDRDGRERLREAGRQRAALYSWERCARETVRVLERAAMTSHARTSGGVVGDRGGSAARTGARPGNETGRR